jgi:hypothetical protein
MKKKLFMQAIIISFLFLALVSVLIYWNFISWNTLMNNVANAHPRRYIDLSQSHDLINTENNFFQLSVLQFDNIFMKTFYLLVILQSIFLVRRLKIKNAFLVSGWLLSSMIGGFFILGMNTFREYFVVGLNPYLTVVPIFSLLLQLIIWAYLNMLLFKKLGEQNSGR